MDLPGPVPAAAQLVLDAPLRRDLAAAEFLPEVLPGVRGRWRCAPGALLGAATGTQLLPVLVSDQLYGAIVAWQDNRGANTDVYAQRVSGAGSALWTANGVALCNATGNQGTANAGPANAGAGGGYPGGFATIRGSRRPHRRGPRTRGEQNAWQTRRVRAPWPASARRAALSPSPVPAATRHPSRFTAGPCPGRYRGQRHAA